MIIIPREICCHLEQAFAREWLVTNGLGGYASGSIAGANTRRYHGLLVPALRPPLERTVMLSKIDEEVEVDGFTYRLGTNEYESGTVHPDGYLYLERVELEGMIPTFVYKAPGFLISKTIWMEHESSTTYVRYTLSPTSSPIQLTLLPFCTYRNAHHETRGSIDWHFAVETEQGGLEIRAFPAAVPYRVLTHPNMAYMSLNLWYWRFKHRWEVERGLDAIEDLYVPGQFRAPLEPGDSITVIATIEPDDQIDRDGGAALERERARQCALKQGARDDLEEQLFAAADQFIVRREVDGAPLHSILAGYHWFSDWGRDAMISLEGLTLITGRHEVAREVLLTFGRLVDRGMIPNRFLDPQEDTKAELEYNAIDATLWYFHAIDRYLSATRDEQLLRDLFPTLVSIVDWHFQGTRHNVHVDPADGLLYGGETGIQPTWMDAKVGDWVVTPRVGKPVEVNALWYSALRRMDKWAAGLGASRENYADAASRVRASFERYWCAEKGYLYDVLDGPNGADATLRPNQLFALVLVDDLVPHERAVSILNVVQRELLTPCALRSLAPQDTDFHYFYRGDQRERDSSYHRGTAWPWLVGAYVDAYLRVFDDRKAVRLLDALPSVLSDAGIGTLGEIQEPVPPFRAVGCIAQAWSVAEVLRAYRRLSAQDDF